MRLMWYGVGVRVGEHGGDYDYDVCNVGSDETEKKNQELID